MGIIYRIDVDRPYGKATLPKLLMSRLASELYAPKLECLGYLRDLMSVLERLSASGKKAHCMFRKCTAPTTGILEFMERKGHVLGLHMENTRTERTFVNELKWSRGFGDVVTASKHGSGVHRYGLWHYKKYEPEKYVAWAQKHGLRWLFGNGESPDDMTVLQKDGFIYYSDCFWLDEYWRDTAIYNLDWLQANRLQRDIVVLIHPGTVTADASVADMLHRIIELDS